MRILHIVGRSGHGKTRLVVELLGEFRRRGVRVGTLKHSSHSHDLDRPGKDSWRHREAGADPAAFVTPTGVAVVVSRTEGQDPIERVAPLYASVDLLLVEGFIDRPGTKIEVYRAAAGGEPLAVERSDIVAVVSDDAPVVDRPVWPRGDVAALADRFLSLDVRGES